MIKQLKFVVLVLACGAVAYGFAWQSRIAAPVSTAEESAARSQGGPAVSPARRARLKDGFTKFQDALASHIIHEGVRVIDATREPRKLEPRIVAQNYLLMLVESPPQQDNHLGIINIERMQEKSPAWNKVRNAPSRVSHLLKVSAEQRAQIELWEARGYPPMPGQRVETNASFWDRYRLQLAQQRYSLRKILNVPQREEWDRLLATIDAEYRDATSR
jgi:hypothetical protein